MPYQYQLEVAPQWKAQLKAGIKSGMHQLLDKSILVNGQGLIKEAADIMVTIFNETPVVMALRGQGPPDLSAHFGLPETVLSDMADQMAAKIRKSIRIRMRRQNNLIITLEAFESSYSEFMKLPYASYVSAPSNITIPLMRWMLLDPNIDIGQAAYAIVFAADSKNPEAIIKASRSGKAIMEPLKIAESKTPYVLPDIFRTAGENFMIYAIAQPQVVEWMAARIMGRLNKVGGSL